MCYVRSYLLGNLLSKNTDHCSVSSMAMIIVYSNSTDACNVFNTFKTKHFPTLYFSLHCWHITQWQCISLQIAILQFF